MSYVLVYRLSAIKSYLEFFMLSYSVSANSPGDFSWLLLSTHHFHPKSIAAAASRSPPMDLPSNHVSLRQKNCKQKRHENMSHVTLSNSSKRSVAGTRKTDHDWGITGICLPAFRIGNYSCECFFLPTRKKKKEHCLISDNFCSMNPGTVLHSPLKWTAFLFGFLTPTAVFQSFCEENQLHLYNGFEGK